MCLFHYVAAFILPLFALGDPQLGFYKPFFEIKLCYHKGVALLLYLGFNLVYLVPVQQKPSRPVRVGPVHRRHFVGRNVGVKKEHLAVFYNSVAFFEVDIPKPYALYLGA